MATLLIALLLCAQAHAASITYTYDGLNRLKKADYGNGTYIEYSYDAAGNRLGLVSYSSGGGSSTTLPSVSTGSASSIATTSATLGATVNPNGLSTTAWFEYGTTTGYGATTSTQSIGSETSAVSASQSISGLTAGTTYHFRVVAQNSAGTSYGGDQTLTTTSGTTTSVAIGYGRASFSFGAATGGSNPADQILTVWNNGTGTLNWSISDNAAWLGLSPQSGTDSGTVTVSADITGLSEGTYSATITISATGATSVDIPVTLTITNSSALPEILWTKQLGSADNDYANALAIDSSGNSYIVGYTSDSLDGSTSAGSEDIVVVKYDSNGSKLWSRQIGTSSRDRAWGVAVDSNGNAYVTGWTEGGLDGNTNAGSGLSDIFLIKYDTDGNKLWTRQTGTVYMEGGYGISVDNQGNAYIAGYTNGGLDGNTNADGGDDIFLLKYDTNGNKLWTNQMAISGSAYAYGVSVDLSGNAYVTGYTTTGLDGNTSAGNSDIFLVKYDSSGVKQWTKQLGSTSDDQAFAVSVDTSGQAYVTGWTNGGLDGSTNFGGWDIFLVKYDSSGVKQWTKQIGTENTDMGGRLTVDASGNVYITGYTGSGLDGNTSAGGKDIFLVKYDPSGIKQWTKQMGTSSSDYGRGVAVDGNGNIYVGGYTSGGLEGNANAGLSDLFVMKLGSVSTEADITAPTTTASPAGGTFTSAQSVTLTASESATIYYTTDGSIPSTSSAVYSSPLTVSSSTTLKFFAVDAAGNIEAVKTEEYTISSSIGDTTAPINTTPSNFINDGAASTSSCTVSLSISATDSVGVTGYLIQEGESSTVINCMSDPAYDSVICPVILASIDSYWQSVTSTISYSATVTAESGLCASDLLRSGYLSNSYSTTFSVWFKDAAGNVSTAAKDTIMVGTIDTIVPVLTLSTLSNNSVTNNNTLNISGTVTDNTGTQSLTVNGNAVTINTDDSFSHALALNEGANIITTVATDLAGNQTTDTRTITLDITAPALAIDTPADNSKTAASIATVRGTIDENSTVAVTLNGGTPQYASVTGSTFTLDIVLASGVNTIEVTATDTAGNTSTEKRTVTYDNTKPSLEITEPNQDIRTNQGSIIIKGAISDALTAVSVSVTVDGNTYNPAISNGQFEQAVTFIAEKTYTVTVTATDEAGNTTTAQRNIIYDITQPVINFTTTTPTNIASQTITGTMEERATVIVTSATATIGTVTYPSSTTWRVNVTGMMEGSNTITATAKDAAGNETTVAKQIVVDTVAPVTTATPGGGTYSSAQGVTLVTNETATIYYTTDGTTPITLSTVYTTPITISTTTTLKFFAKDNAGNSSAVSSEIYTINSVAAIDTTPPSDVSNLTATSKDDGSIYLSWTAPSDADLKGYNVYRDGTKVNTGTIATTSYKDSDTTSGTTYTYKVTSLDLAENESTGATKSITAVVQDNTPPSAVSSIKVEDTKTGGSLKVVWTANTEADLSGYKVYLGTSSGSYTNTYEAGNTTAYTVTGLNDGAKYYIAVTAYDTDGNESAKSVESTESPTTATITLNPPTNLTVTTGNEYITLSWTGVSNVTGYLVYIGNTDGAYGTSARTTNTTYTYSNLNNNQTYYVAVSSYTNNGSSDTISAESERTASSGTPSDNNPPSSPTNITATTGTSGSVSLKWDRAEDSDISGYMLAYKESGSSTFTGMVSISAQWSYTITGLTDGVTYDFYLYAYDKNGNFSEPATTSATPTNSGSTADLTPPSPPILSAVPGDKKVTLIITASSDTDIDIDHYNLYVYNLASEKYMPLTSINGLTYEHSEGVGNGEALVYVATAVDASGNESGYSEAASAVANELPGDIPLEEDPPVADRVDGYDVNEMAKGFGTEIGDLDYNPNADLTGDGAVDGDDLLILGTNHGKKKE